VGVNDGWLAYRITLFAYVHRYVAGQAVIGETTHCEQTDTENDSLGESLYIDQAGPGLVRYHVIALGETMHFTYSGPYLIEWDQPQSDSKE
jgi:hypothetical protein